MSQILQLKKPPAPKKKSEADAFAEIPEQEKKLLRLLGNHLLAQFEEELKNENSHAIQHD